jgi:hypothetical protein
MPGEPFLSRTPHGFTGQASRASRHFGQVRPQATGPVAALTSSAKARISAFSGMSLMLCP